MKQGMFTAVLVVTTLTASATNADSVPEEIVIGDAMPGESNGSSRKTVETGTAVPLLIPGTDVAGDSAGQSFDDCVSFLADPVNQLRIWFSADYLYWWIKPQPLPTLLTADDAPISIFDFTMFGSRPIFEFYPTGRTVLVGGENDYGGFSGARTTVGMWLDATAINGVEVSGFALEERTRFFSIATNGFGKNAGAFGPGGQPYLAIPYTVGNPGATAIGPTALPFSSFGNQAANDQAIDGAFMFSTSSRLWGIEGNAIRNLARGSWMSWDLLCGFRFLQLDENVTYTAIELDAVERDSVASDFFGGTTDFYGLQIGSRLQAEGTRWSAQLGAKAALGGNHQQVRIEGKSAQFDLESGVILPGGGPFPSGIFALPSNTGRHDSSSFSVLSEVELKLGYRLTPRLRTVFGYNFLYWLNVVRPGNQIDTTVLSTTYNKVGGAPEGLDLHVRRFSGDGTVAQPGVGAGAVGRPGVLFRESNFWAHGFSVGLELTW